jgi:polysaccharide export outer membrane protein
MTSLVTLVLALLLAPQASTQTQKPAPAAPAPATSVPQQAAPALQPTGVLPMDYRIGPADMLLITVTDEPGLTGKFLVDSDGMFSFPYLTRVRAAGMTSSELQQRLTSLLQAGYLRNPQIRVQIDSFRSQSVMVIGEVRQPGKIPMTGASMTLLEALVAAGSATVQASNEIIVRHRGVDGKEGEDVRVNRRELELGRNDVQLRDGDIINVPSAQHFYVEGMVRTPGYYVLDPGMTVQQAIALAGGLNDRGSDRGITATRLVKGKTTDVPVKLDDKILPNDTIHIRARFF